MGTKEFAVAFYRGLSDFERGYICHANHEAYVSLLSAHEADLTARQFDIATEEAFIQLQNPTEPN